MPDISLTASEKGFTVRQTDPWKRGLVWPQRFAVKVVGEKDTLIHVDLTTNECEIPLGFAADKLLPNYDGRGYGRFLLDKPTADYLLNHWAEEKDDLARQSYLMTLYENMLCFRISNSDFVRSLLAGLKHETNDLVASSAVNYLWNSILELRGDEREVTEVALFDMSNEHLLTSCRIQLKRMLRDVAESPKVVGELYAIWDAASDQLLSERDYTLLAYNLCLKMPEKYEAIFAKQRARISNSDRLREFDFIIPSLTSDSLKRDSLFQSLSKAENRRIEPWTQTVLAFLNHRSHETGSVKYIRPGLDLLKEVQRTGDIFFPRGWANALIGSHRSAEAYQAVKTFFSEHPDYPQLLKNKILQAAYPLYRANGEWIEPQK
jgi:aminopeptidase N